MKKLLLNVMLMSSVALSASAQFEAGTQVSYLTGHGKNDNHTSLIGAMVYGRFKITDNTAIGSAIHRYTPKKSRYTDGSISYYATDDVTNVAATYETMLGVSGSPFQTYFGTDIGVSTSNHKVEYVTDMGKTLNYNLKQTYMMLSPKAGVLISLGAGFGMFSQVQYNFSPGDGGKKIINLPNAKGVYTLTTEPISKYYNIDTGIYLQIGNLRKIP